MRYVRFLKPPKAEGELLKALVTVTSDLGDSFLAEDVALTALLSDSVGIILVTKHIYWTSGMRSLPVSLDIPGGKLEWPVRLHVRLNAHLFSDHFGHHLSSAELPCVISAWSSGIDLPKRAPEAEKIVERRFTRANDQVLSIWEETGESIARHVWDAGVALSAYIDLMRKGTSTSEGFMRFWDVLGLKTRRRLSVLELGSGCGIVGITLAEAISNCDVILSDLPEAAEICLKNISGAQPAILSTLRFTVLDWEAPLPPSVCGRVFDLVIVADCTYNPDSGPALVSTLSTLLQRSPNMLVLVAMKVRHASEAVFFKYMSRAQFLRSENLNLPIPTEESAEQEKIELHLFHGRERPGTRLPQEMRADRDTA